MDLVPIFLAAGGPIQGSDMMGYLDVVDPSIDLGAMAFHPFLSTGTQVSWVKSGKFCFRLSWPDHRKHFKTFITSETIYDYQF